jgi:hypothetical protein
MATKATVREMIAADPPEVVPAATDAVSQEMAPIVKIARSAGRTVLTPS